MEIIIVEVAHEAPAAKGMPARCFAWIAEIGLFAVMPVDVGIVVHAKAAGSGFSQMGTNFLRNCGRVFSQLLCNLFNGLKHGFNYDTV